MEIRVNLNPLEETTAFTYLGRTVMYNNIYWSALYSKLSKDQWRWGVVVKVLVNMGTPLEEWAMMYKAILNVLLL